MAAEGTRVTRVPGDIYIELNNNLNSDNKIGEIKSSIFSIVISARTTYYYGPQQM